MIQGLLTGMGYLLQHYRVREFLQRIDPLGNLLCRSQTIRCPRIQLHIDGHHSLVRWGFVIHGAVDGFFRLFISAAQITTERVGVISAGHYHLWNTFKSTVR